MTMCRDYKETRNDRPEESRSSDVIYSACGFCFHPTLHSAVMTKRRESCRDMGRFPITFPNGRSNARAPVDTVTGTISKHFCTVVLLAANYQV